MYWWARILNKSLYTKPEVNAVLTNYYTKSLVLNKTQINEMLLPYSLKTEVDDLSINYYTKSRAFNKTEIYDMRLLHYTKIESGATYYNKT